MVKSYIFLIDLFFWNSFRFIAQLNKKSRKFPFTSYPCTWTASSTVNILYHSGEFVTTHKPTLTHHNHSKSIACLRVHSWSCMVYGLNKCIIAYIHHYNIIQSVFTALKILCALCSSVIWFSVYGIPWKMSKLNSRTRRDMTFFILLVHFLFHFL